MADQLNDESPRRVRPPSVAYLQKTDAIRIVAPITEQLAVWSARVAFLRAMARRAGVPAAARETSIAEARVMLDDVRRARDDLAAQSKALPPEIASHSRLVDTRRSLDALESQLSEALPLLAR